MFYAPFLQHQLGNTLQALQLRTAMAPESMIPEIEREIEKLAPQLQLPVFDVQTLSRALNTLNGLLFYKIDAALAALLGMLGLVLAIVGVYGVVSYATAQKTHEIGLRRALGAEPVDILKMISREGLLIVGIGLVVGVLGALAAGRVVGSFLTVSARDPITHLAVTTLLTLVALTACFIPARRAMRWIQWWRYATSKLPWLEAAQPPLAALFGIATNIPATGHLTVCIMDQTLVTRYN
jgi:predicted lysophospholipase L1 biosynthesis ABC-type transport system permease subunit